MFSIIAGFLGSLLIFISEDNASSYVNINGRLGASALRRPARPA